MKRGSEQSTDRGVSEIYGTALIISLVLIVALLIVGTGTFVVSQLTQDTTEQISQDAVLEMGDRLDGITEDEIDDSTVFEFPDGAGEQMDANSSEGAVTISIEVNDSYIDSVEAYNDLDNLLTNNPNYDGTYDPNNGEYTKEIEMGTIVHETEDGVLTAYQGGAVWERQSSGYVQPASSPPLAYDGDTIDLSFVSIDGVDSIQEGEELTAEQMSTAGSDEISRAIAMMQNITGTSVPGNAPLNITVEIESERFAHGWAQYAQEGLDEQPASVTPDPSSGFQNYGDTVTINFGWFGNGFGTDSPDFGDNIIYSGVDSAAHVLYNETTRGQDNELSSGSGGDREFVIDEAVGEQGNPEQEYVMAAYDGEDWWYQNQSTSSGATRWVNVESGEVFRFASGTQRTNAYQNGEFPFKLQDSFSDRNKFEFDQERIICIIGTDDSTDPSNTLSSGSDYEDAYGQLDGNLTEDASGNQACLEEMVGVENEDAVAPEPETQDFRISFQNDGIDPQAIWDESDDADPGVQNVDPANLEVEYDIEWVPESGVNRTTSLDVLVGIINKTSNDTQGFIGFDENLQNPADSFGFQDLSGTLDDSDMPSTDILKNKEFGGLFVTTVWDEGQHTAANFTNFTTQTSFNTPDMQIIEGPPGNDISSGNDDLSFTKPDASTVEVDVGNPNRVKIENQGEPGSDAVTLWLEEDGNFNNRVIVDSKTIEDISNGGIENVDLDSFDSYQATGRFVDPTKDYRLNLTTSDDYERSGTFQLDPNTGPDPPTLTVNDLSVYNLSQSRTNDPSEIDYANETETVSVNATVEAVDADIDDERLVQIRYEDGVIGTAAVNNLDKGNTEEIGITWEIPPEFTGNQGSITEELTATADESATTDLEIQAKEDLSDTPKLEVSNIDLPDEADEGDSVTVEATIENVGAELGDAETRLVLLEAAGLPANATELQGSDFTNGETTVALTWDVSPTFVDSGNQQEATVRVSADESATQDITINDVDAGEDAPQIEVTSIGVDDDNPEEGDTITVTAGLENTGEEETTRLLLLSVDDNPVDSKEVTLGGGNTDSTDIEWDVPTTFVEDAGEDGSATVSVEVAADTSKDTSITVDEVDADPDASEVLVSNVDAPDTQEGETMTVGFDVENTGDEETTRVVGIVADGDPVAATELTLSAGEERTNVEITWDVPTDFVESGDEQDVQVEVTADNSNSDDATITAIDGNDPSVVDVTDVSASNADEGDTVTVTATLDNDGPATTRYVSLAVNGDSVTATEVSLNEDQTGKSVDLQWTVPVDFVSQQGTSGSAPADLTVTADSSASDSITINEVDDAVADPPQFNIISTSTDDELEPGEDFTVTAEVENTGATGTQPVSLFVPAATDQNTFNVQDDGDLAGVQNVEIPAGETREVEFTWEDTPNLDPTQDHQVEVVTRNDNELINIEVAGQIIIENVGASTTETNVVEPGQDPQFIDLSVTDNSCESSDSGCSQDQEEVVFDYEVDSTTNDFEKVELVMDPNGYGTYPELTGTAEDGTITFQNDDEYGYWFPEDPYDIEHDVTLRVYNTAGDIVQEETFQMRTDGNDPDVSNVPEPLASGQETNSASVTVTAEYTGNGQPAGAVTVELETVDGRTLTDTNPSTSQQFDFDYNPSFTGDITISTRDDTEDKQLNVITQGPDCNEISYDGGTGSDSNPYQISHVGQLQCMNEDLEASYELIDDIDASGTENWNGGKGFEPIGSEGHDSIRIEEDYENWEMFEGVFDGNAQAGYSIEGLYINRPDESFVGLFGATSWPWDEGANDPNYPDYPNDPVDPGDGSTIENVVLEDADISGFRYVGALAGQAGGEIRNARAEGSVTGQSQLVGGLIGLGAHADLNNKIVADVDVTGGPTDPNDIWSDTYDVEYGNAKGIGGLIGRAAWNTDISVGYSWSEVSGPINVGGIIGSSSLVQSDFESLYTNASVSATNGDAGAVVGIVQHRDDFFADSIYYDETVNGYGTGAAGEGEYWDGRLYDMDPDTADTNWISRTEDEMQGLGVNTGGRMGNLQFIEDGGPWVAIDGEYPRFAWEITGEAEIEIDGTNASPSSPIEEGDTLEVDVTVEGDIPNAINPGERTRTVALYDIPDDNGDRGEPVATKEITLDEHYPGEGPETVSTTIEWETTRGDAGEGDITAEIVEVDSQDTEEVKIEETEPDRSTFNVDSVALTDSDDNDVAEDNPIEQGETMTVTAGIEHIAENHDGDGSTEVLVLIEPDDASDNAIPLGSAITPDIADGDVESVDIDVTVPGTLDLVGDPAERDIIVRTTDDDGTATSYIRNPGGLDSEFNVDDITLKHADDESSVTESNPVPLGESMLVETEVSHVAEHDEDGTAEVLVLVEGDADNPDRPLGTAEITDITPGESGSTTLNVEIPRTLALENDIEERDIIVRTQTDQGTAAGWFEDPAASDSTFTVGAVDLRDSKGEDVAEANPVEKGGEITIDTSVTHDVPDGETADDDEVEVLFLVEGNADNPDRVLASETYTIDDDDTEEIEKTVTVPETLDLDLASSDPQDRDIIVTTPDAESTGTAWLTNFVDDEPTFDVSIGDVTDTDGDTVAAPNPADNAANLTEEIEVGVELTSQDAPDDAEENVYIQIEKANGETILLANESVKVGTDTVTVSVPGTLDLSDDPAQRDIIAETTTSDADQTILVSEKPDEDTAEFTLDSVTVEDSNGDEVSGDGSGTNPIEQGKDITVRTDVTHEADSGTEEEITVFLGIESDTGNSLVPVTSETITLGPGETQELTIQDVTVPETFEITNWDVRELEVATMDDAATTNINITENSGPGASDTFDLSFGDVYNKSSSSTSLDDPSNTEEVPYGSELHEVNVNVGLPSPPSNDVTQTVTLADGNGVPLASQQVTIPAGQTSPNNPVTFDDVKILETMADDLQLINETNKVDDTFPLSPVGASANAVEVDDISITDVAYDGTTRSSPIEVTPESDGSFKDIDVTFEITTKNKFDGSLNVALVADGLMRVEDMTVNFPSTGSTQATGTLSWDMEQLPGETFDLRVVVFDERSNPVQIELDIDDLAPGVGIGDENNPIDIDLDEVEIS